MAILPGTRLGPYEVLIAIGAGGMGEVYRARDSKLARDIALKVLPAAFTADSERMARFEREARLLAALNHPHIAAIYGLEESSGTPALVMELVEGPTLADRIAAGPIPLDETLPIAKQIAEALEYAHEKGIVHRDLKPANIKVKPDGTVKVLDLGLAKALTDDPTMGDMANSPTLSMGATVAGVILGTAAYMSPERAKAKPGDRRADIWAFGVVLYEMLTGKQLYTGETAAETLASVIKETPDLTKLPASTPPAIRNLVQRCLEKDPRERLQHIGEARIAIAHAGDTPVAPAPMQRPQMVRGLIALAGVLLAGAAVFAFAYFHAAPPPQAPAIRFPLEMPDGWELARNIGPTGFSLQPLAVSPDGRFVGFLATKSDGTTQLWVRSLDTIEARVLAGTEGASAPFWSPDGRFLGFFADGKLKKIEISGGPPMTLCDAPDNRGGTWGRDGTIIFTPLEGTGLLKVPSSGGIPSPATVLAPGERSQLRPSFLPDGRHFLYRSFSQGLPSSTPTYIGTLGSNDRKLLFTSDAANADYSMGHLLFLRDATLMAQSFDPNRLELAGDAFPIAQEIETQSNGHFGLFSASEGGVLVYQAGNASTNNQLVWFDRSGKEIGTLGEPAHYGFLEFSPDGKRASVAIWEGGKPAIWIYDIARGIRTRFTFTHLPTTASIWSPDGTRIVFYENDGAQANFYQKSSDSSSTDEPLLVDNSFKYPLSWSPDGRFILYNVLGLAHRDLYVLPLSGDRKAVPFQTGQANEDSGRFSPDGKWIAYSSNESGRNEIYVAPFPGPGGKWQISNGGGNFPRWRKDGSEIFYLSSDGKLMAAEVNGKGPSFEVGTVKALFATSAVVGFGSSYDVSADGQRFLINTRPEHEITEPLTVVVNWPAGVKK